MPHEGRARPVPNRVDPVALERSVVDLARRLASGGRGEQTRVYRMSFWSERLLEWAMRRPGFKTQLFRFVDVFPALGDDADVVRHLDEYFSGGDTPAPVGWGISVARRVPVLRAVPVRVARSQITRMGSQFIVGADAAAAVPVLGDLWHRGRATTVDLLGEKTVVSADAERYSARVHDLIDTLAAAAAGWSPRPRLEADDLGPLPRANVSVKPTALSAHFHPLTRSAGLAEAGERLAGIYRHARAAGVFVHLDMEHHDVKDLTFDLLRAVLALDEFAELEAGIVVQAYLKGVEEDLADIVALSASRARPLTVRLVKGAYWDTEGVVAKAAGWPVPTFEYKPDTDAAYEAGARLLLNAHGSVRAAFASHNLRSLAYAAAYARALGLSDEAVELQMLYGMAEPMQAAVVDEGFRLRLYCPVGEVVPGMAYLVRRLLENTSNESFVRHRYAEGVELDQLLRSPDHGELPGRPDLLDRPPTDPDSPSPYEPEAPRPWFRRSARSAFAAAADAATRREAFDVPAVIDGVPFMTAAVIESRDPTHPDRIVARSASVSVADVDRAVAGAVAAAGPWAAWPARDRAAVLFRAAGILRSRRDRLAALEVVEAAKPWAEADGDLCEAIDFCEYYGREALRLADGGEVQSPPGERNRLSYHPRGVVAVIAPWNFPLAIPTGMVTAALVTGNSVLFKPAEQTPAIAAALVEALTAAGLPAGVCQFLPGPGETVGARLVAHPQVGAIAFTGSMAVGLEILRVAAIRQPGQRMLKRVICELGGKNPLIVDADADPDQVVPIITHGAFGFAGQKCSATSRLIVLDRVYDSVVARLLAAVDELVVGDPADPATQVPPVIEQDARDRIEAMVAATPGRVHRWGGAVPQAGWFVRPTVVTDLSPDDDLACDEVFGPVLSVFRARDFDHAVELANDTDYALTAGLCSRSPAHLARAARELRAGNVYLNRSTTGAVVGRQPFGGFGLSGVGSKAGGPDYLLQFCDPRNVTENTLRQGFAPDE